MGISEDDPNLPDDDRDIYFLEDNQWVLLVCVQQIMKERIIK